MRRARTVLELDELCEHGTGTGNQLLTGGSRCEALRGAREQRDPELALDGKEAAADGRLREVDARRGAHRGAHLGERQHELEVAHVEVGLRRTYARHA